MPPKIEDPAASPKRKPILSKVEAIVLIAVAAMAIALAVPHMRNTYVEAIFTGKCSENSDLPACNPQGGPTFSVPVPPPASLGR